jgi:beta-lactamase regulating signal transducer with metallopeptidase domain
MRPSEWSAALAGRLVDIPFSEMVLLKITVLLAVAWALHRALARANPRWRVLLWRGVVVAVVLGPVWMRFGPPVTVSIAEQPKSVESQTTAPASSVLPTAAPAPTVADVAEGQDIVRPKSHSSSHASKPSTATPTASLPAKAGAEAMAVASTENRPAVATNGWALFWAALVRVIWLIGFLLVAVRTVVGHWRVARLLATASPAPDWILEIGSRVIRELPCRNRVDVVVSSRAQVPFLCGLWRQRVVVPDKFCDRKYEEYLPAIFAHELAHAQAHDVWWNTLVRIVAAALWFHPLAWKMPQARSASCEDVGDAVSATYVGDARFYSRVLARVALELLSRPATTAVAMARTAEISRRLDALARTVPYRSVPRWALAGTASVCLAVALGAASLRLAFARPSTTTANKTDGPAAAKTADPGQRESELLSRVFTAWRARQERVKTLHVTWKSRLLLTKGFQYQEPSQWPIAGMDPDEESFKVANQFECQLAPSDLWGDEQGRLRDDLTVVRSHALKEPKPAVRVRTVVDGMTHSRLVMPISNEAPLMTIWREVPFAINSNGGMYAPQAAERRNREAELMPLVLALRPESQAAGIVPGSCQVVEEDAIVDKIHRLKIRMESRWPRLRQQRRDERADNADTFWVDPSRDYVIVLWERNWLASQPGTSVIAVKIDYRRDDKLGWLPSHWETRLKKGLRGTDLAIHSVTQAAINEPLPPETFARSGPPRTRVYDVTIDENLTAKLAEESAKPAQLPDPSMNAIVAAWTRRQAKFRSFHFSWQKNWNFNYRYEQLAKRPDVHAEFQDFRSNDSHWLDGPRWAMEQIVVECPEHINLMRTLKCAFGGESTRTYFKYFRQTNDEPNAGKVRRGFDTRMFARSDGRKLMLALRTASSEYSGLNPLLCRVLPITAKVGEIDCKLLHTANEHGENIFYWLDPARDDLVLREHTTSGGRDISQIDFSYCEDATAGWVPDSWTQKQLGQYGCLVTSLT